MRKLIVATTNPHKVEEISAVLGPLGIECVPLPNAGIPEPVEDGATFEANARLKAVALCEATGMPAIADDTALPKQLR